MSGGCGRGFSFLETVGVTEGPDVASGVVHGCIREGVVGRVVGASDFRSFLPNSEDFRISTDLLPISIDFKQILRILTFYLQV